jgi:hypothetical protein
MPGSQESDDFEDDPPPKLKLGERLKYAIVKHDTNVDERAKDQEEELSVEELEEAVARADDKERAIGLVAAPFGAVIALIVGSTEIHHAQSLGQSLTTYEELLGVLALMSVLMLVTAALRKRLFLGIAMALYGLGVFNLHYWGFGIPFILGGAWYLVRAYRLQQRLKYATTNGSTGTGTKRTGYQRPAGVLPRPNKRYTPRTAPARRPTKPKPKADT